MKILKIASVAVFGVLIIVLFIFRGIYAGDKDIVTEEMYIYGIENGMGIKCGESADSVFVSVPSSMDIKDIVSFSSDTDIAYIKINKDEPYNVRILEAQIIGVSPGIAEIYVGSSDGSFVSEKFSVYCYGETETKPSYTAESVTKATDDGDISDPVYVTPHGTKYHLDPDCAGDTASIVSLEAAVDKGYLPCKKCAEK